MVGVALFVWGAQWFPRNLHSEIGWWQVAGPALATLSLAFLVLLWIGKINSMITDLLLGAVCVDDSDHSRWDSNHESRQIDEAVQLYRRGQRRRALRLCNRIIASDSQYATTATTLAFWIENPGTPLRFHTPPRTNLRFKRRMP